MEKMITLFVRNFDLDCPATPEISSGAEWVTAGEGRATQKLDGTACLVRDGKLYKRYTVREGKKPPANFEPTGEPHKGKRPGWVPVGDGPEDKWHREAFAPMVKVWKDQHGIPVPDGTFELVGPKVQNNAEEEWTDNRYRLYPHMGRHRLYPHLALTFSGEKPPRDYDGLIEWFKTRDIEGVVWHHPDGRMVKIKKSDFGLPRKPAKMDPTKPTFSRPTGPTYKYLPEHSHIPKDGRLDDEVEGWLKHGDRRFESDPLRTMRTNRRNVARDVIESLSFESSGPDIVDHGAVLAFRGLRRHPDFKEYSDPELVQALRLARAAIPGLDLSK
jgi:hypothetical protein